jgi:hypothetical protein
MSNKEEEKISLKLSKKEAIKELWYRGSLQYLLKGKQVEIYEALKKRDEDINVICCSRRFGKSFILCVLAVETCLRQKEAVVKYAAPTKVQVEEIVNKVMRPILADCPVHLMPTWMEAKKRFIFPNGSEIQIAATDNGHIENLRGGYSHLCVVDEAGFATDLSYAIDSVLAPTTDTTDGYIILASTPNYKDPQHEFNTEYMLPRQENGTLKKFTIYDSPMITPERLEKIVERYGLDSAKFRCEYLCEIAYDSDYLVIGEMSPEKEKEIIQEVVKPPFYDAYVSADWGFKDATGILFAYYDFYNSAIVVIDELVVRGKLLTSEYIAEIIKQKEIEHFRCPQTGLQKDPFLRVADNNNPILLNDLYRLHSLLFVPTAKDNKDAQINEVKLRIRSNRLIIHPRCKNLLYHIKSAKWNKNRNGFENLRDNKEQGLIGGHADLLDALIYLVRNVAISKNPFPDDYFHIKGPNVWGSQPKSGVGESLKQMLNIKPKKDTQKFFSNRFNKK